MLKPAMPVITDVVAHTFWKNVHIAVVHRINGKEHVHYELRRLAADADKDKSGLKHKGGFEDLYHLVAVIAPALILQHTADRAIPVFYCAGIYEDTGKMPESPPPKRES